MYKARFRAFFDSLVALLKQSAPANESAFAFFIIVFLVAIAYRVQLTFSFFHSRVKPFDFNPGVRPLWFFLRYLPFDVILAVLCLLLGWLVMKGLMRVSSGTLRHSGKLVGLVVLHLLVISFLLIHAAHLRLLFNVQTGLTLSAVMEVFSGVSLSETLKFADARDAAALLLSFGLFWLFLLSPRIVKRWLQRISFSCVVLVFLVSAVAPGRESSAAPAEIRLNPVLYFVSDVLEQTFYGLVPGHGNPLVQNGSRYYPIRPFDRGKIVHNQNPHTVDSHPWNVVLFVMESVGTRYIFDTSHGNRMPMPFLYRLSRDAWSLQNHFTSSNLSTKALFSILSGHYDLFDRRSFGVGQEVHIPSLSTFLGDKYDSFLVTPSSLSWYFPAAFVKNSGLREIHSYENLPFAIKEEFHALGHYIARDEIQTVDHFIQRINKAREPFLGIYVSFAAHFPYFDYGTDYRIMEEDGRLISRYYNNLNLLDRMIQRIYEHLEKQGQLDRTLLAIVGDHGQAFGQHHSDNYMHYRYSYNENLEAPAFLYQPSLLGSRIIRFPTSHVDLLPTILDALKVPYDSALFEGESLLDSSPKRSAIFCYGYEGTVSSVDTDLVKMQYSIKKKKAWAFNLRSDPEETTPQEASSYVAHLGRLRTFAAGHDSQLVQFNKSLSEKEGLRGEGEPSP